MFPDMAELVNYGETAQDGPIPNLYVSSQGCCIGHDDVIADLTIMGDVNIGHKQIVIANACGHGILGCAAVQRGKLADDIAVTDLKASLFTTVFEILGIVADRGELEDPIIDTESCGSLDNGMWADGRAFADLDTRTYDCKWADADAFVQFSIVIDYGTGIDQSEKSLYVHRISAVAATLPSTVALPEKKPMPLLIDF
jgi:hypothetical protein